MSLTFANIWFRDADLAASIPGREDAADLVADCLAYLRGWHFREQAKIEGKDERTRKAIFAAHVQNAAANPRIQELEQQVSQQHATINRLLAFVPAHARSLPDKRVSEIADTVLRLAAELFGGNRVSLQIRDEDDANTEACHRFQLVVRLATDEPIERLVATEVALHRAFVEQVTQDEVRAISLLVDYE